jgi:hypothetical protein
MQKGDVVFQKAGSFRMASGLRTTVLSEVPARKIQ